MISSPLGYGVVRLRSSSQQVPNVTVLGVQYSDTLGIFVFDPQVRAGKRSSQKWLCPTENQSCIKLEFKFVGQLDQDLQVACLHWSDGSWGGSNCTAEAKASETEPGSILVDCLCHTDGLFKAFLTPTTDFGTLQQPFIIAVQFNCITSSVWAVCMVSFVCVVLGSVILISLVPLLMKVLKMKYEVDFDLMDALWNQNLDLKELAVPSACHVCSGTSDKYWTDAGFPTLQLCTLTESRKGLTLSADLCTASLLEVNLRGIGAGLRAASRNDKKIYLEAALQPILFLDA